MTVKTNIPEVDSSLDQSNHKSQKDLGVALLLCLLLGEFGAHYFYVGRIRKGILYILTFGLLGIGIVIDFFIILLGNFKDSEDKLIESRLA